MGKITRYPIKRAIALSLAAAILLSIVDAGISQINRTHNAYGQLSSTASTCQRLPITSVTANVNGLLAANVLDNNLNTAWSNNVIGSWIRVDLGTQTTICSVSIAWYLGNLLQYNFIISVSNDGTTFTNVFAGKSSGKTLSPEIYNLPGGTTGRYVKVTINGNNVNTLASIAELSVNGFGNAPPPPPTADNKNIQTNSGTPVTITLTGTDPIPGDVLKFSVVANPAHGTLTAPTSNTVTYTPNTGFSGTDSFTYKDTDGQGVSSNIATVTITVNAPPPPPTADNKNIQTNSGTPVQITLTGTDPIPGDVLKFTVVTLPQHGTLSSGTTSNSVTYTPNTGFSGTDSFTYKATDGQGVSSNIATVTITVNAVQNNPPTADNKAISTNAGTPVTITLTGTDPIPGDVLKFSVVANPAHGTLTAPTSNTVTYTPNTGFSGTDSFSYKATDGQGVSSNIATVTITVKAPPPTADNKNVQTNSGSPVQITLTGTDPIPGDVLKFSVVGNPLHGTVTPGTVSSIVFYTPNTGFTGTDSFTYKATDGQGLDSNIATVTIIVGNLYDNFEGGTYTLSDGQTSPNGKWIDNFNGFGSAGVQDDGTGTNKVFFERPATSTSPSETHASSVSSTQKFSDFELDIDTKTLQQLRQNSAPNPWEAATVFFRQTDTFHFYAFVLKTNGFEFDKKDCNTCTDPVQGQQFLVTASSPTLKIGASSHWKITAIGNHITITVDGNKVVDYIDQTMSQQLSSGAVVMYTEDASVNFDNVSITPQ